MKQRLLVFLLIIAVLGAGVVAGIWIERQRPVPPPPARLMAELTTPATRLVPATQQFPLIKLRPVVNRAELTQAIAEIGPQIEAYRAQLAAIEQEFDAALNAMLTPAQREAYVAARLRLEQRQIGRNQVEPAPPLTTDEILNLQHRPSYNVLNMVVVDLKLDWLRRELGLDATQVDGVRALLRQRRERFLALVDATPPPSLMLSDLALAAQRLVEPSPVRTEH
ncbi:MAG: hypothetical protein H3C27_13995 [Opitutaceae bacterium]|nr:hypothetical protein [Opitutaceae bacterium]